MSDEHLELVSTFIARAKERGDRKAAVFLLEEFVNHSDVFQRVDIPASDKAVIDFIVGAIREILSGVPPRKALCLAEPGRPEVPLERKIMLALAVYKEYSSSKSAALESTAINTAIAAVARRQGVSQRTVEAAWRDLGSLGGVSELANLAGLNDEPEPIALYRPPQD